MKKFTESNNVGDYSVLTDTGWSDIKMLHTTINYEVWEIELTNNNFLKCADNHIVFLEDYSEIYVKDLNIGDKIHTNDGLCTVISIYKTGTYEEMYDLELDDENHRYYTNNILSHNTQLAKELNKYMFGTEDTLIRIDMSEYMDRHSTSKLVGAPPGYVGYNEGGFLTEQVRRKPHAVVLFDEIEKAHPDVFNMLLQLLDDGYLTDSAGRHVDFRHCLIIMTSNLGSRKIEDFGTGVGFKSTSTVSKQANDERDIVLKSLKQRFSPEFLNRIDDIVIFNKLSQEVMSLILDKELQELQENIKDVGDYKLTFTKGAKDIIIQQGFDERYGARQITRTVERLVENPISDMILNKDIVEGDHIKVTSKKGELEIVSIKR